RFSELLGTRLAVAVREGSWSVQLDLDAMDLGSVTIQLSAGADGIEGGEGNDADIRLSEL
mgnify:CR=1